MRSTKCSDVDEHGYGMYIKWDTHGIGNPNPRIATGVMLIRHCSDKADRQE